MYNKLGGCWYQHADVLDELTALRAAWYAAYRDPEAPATAAIEWHDRWLPGAMRRCRAAIRARGCKARHEKGTLATVPLMDRQDFRNFIRLGPDTAVPVNDAANSASEAADPASDATDPASEAALANAAEPAPEPVTEPMWAVEGETAPTGSSSRQAQVS